MPTQLDSAKREFVSSQNKTSKCGAGFGLEQILDSVQPGSVSPVPWRYHRPRLPPSRALGGDGSAIPPASSSRFEPEEKSQELLG